MTRYAFCERVLREVYGEQPQDDSNITINLVNSWLADAIGAAAKQNYKEAIQMDGVAYVNNSFYSTFTGIAIVPLINFTYQITLPQIPFGIGKDEGIGTITLTPPDNSNIISLDLVPLSQNQRAYYKTMRPIFNKILYYSEGIFCYLITTLQLQNYKANVTMVSGGDATNINSILNVPDDYVSIMIDYCAKMLIMERQQVKQLQNDGQES